MSERDTPRSPGSVTHVAVLWGGAVIAMAGAVVLVVLITDLFGGDDESPVHVEEFRVAEPLTQPTESAIQARLETITAVTEPFDEVEAAVEQSPEELATNESQLITQCVTVLKEMAFCTGEDSFLDLIGTAPQLLDSEQRQRFMQGVDKWFEPGGSREQCEALLAENASLTQESMKPMWQRSAKASELVCDDFATVLLEVEIFEEIGRLWQ